MNHITISHMLKTFLFLSKILLFICLMCYLLPPLKRSFSVFKLDDDSNGLVEFTPSSVCLKDAHTKKTLASGCHNGNIYVFDEDPLTSKTSFTVVFNAISTCPIHLFYRVVIIHACGT